MRDIQRKSANGEPYMVGMFNGIELCLSMLEDREPEFMENHKIGFDMTEEEKANAKTDLS